MIRREMKPISLENPRVSRVSILEVSNHATHPMRRINGENAAKVNEKQGQSFHSGGLCEGLK